MGLKTHQSPLQIWGGSVWSVTEHFAASIAERDTRSPFPQRRFASLCDCSAPTLIFLTASKIVNNGSLSGSQGVCGTRACGIVALNRCRMVRVTVHAMPLQAATASIQSVSSLTLDTHSTQEVGQLVLKLSQASKQGDIFRLFAKHVAELVPGLTHLRSANMLHLYRAHTVNACTPLHQVWYVA